MIHLGFELKTGQPVAVPLKHLAVTGQTQESGKTTTLEALVARSGLRAVAFVTKRAEGAFRTGRRIPAYYRELHDWRSVSAVLEAVLRERLKFERAWIMRATKGAHSLAEVHANVKTAMEKAKGLSADVYLTLDEYLNIVVPQVTRLLQRTSGDRTKMTLAPGLNIMDLAGYSTELQALVVRSVLEWVYEKEQGVVVIIPEAWEFLPQNRGSPVLLPAEQLIRKGAAAQNFVWLDSQDIAGVHKAILRQVGVWILGVQREANEVKRALLHIPKATPKPSTQEVMALGRGQFIVCYGGQVLRVYVQPAWMDAEIAARHAKAWFLGARGPEAIGTAGTHPEESHPIAGSQSGPPDTEVEEDDEMSAEERENYERRIRQLEDERTQAEVTARQHHGEVLKLNRELSELRPASQALATLRKILGSPAPAVSGDGPPADMDAIVEAVMRRLPAAGGAVYQVVPLEKLRKDFQRQEVERFLEMIATLPPRIRAALTFLETYEGTITQKTLCERLGIPVAGNSFTTFAKGMQEAAELGLVEVSKGHGVRRGLRGRVAAALAHYQASEDEVESTYQTLMAALAAGEGVKT